MDRVKGGEVAVNCWLNVFKDYNPFNLTTNSSKSLCCLSSGQPSSEKVSFNVLGYINAGLDAAEQYIATRLTQKTVKFQNVMKRLNRSTFKSMAVHKKLITSQQKTVEIKAERNLLRWLLFLSHENYTSLPKLFEYPFGPIAWSITTADGGMIKTSKAKLMHHLELLSQPCTYTSSMMKNAITIIDGNALLQSFSHLPETFEDLAVQVFCCLSKSPVAHFVTDYYKFISIKQSERTRCGQTSKFWIGGPKTNLLTGFKSFMLNSSNKKPLIKFLWMNEANMPDGKTRYFVDEEACWILISYDTLVTCVSAIYLCYDPERRLIYRLFCTATSQQDIRTDNAYHCQDSDTYLLVLLVSYASNSLNLFNLDMGSGNKRRMGDIKAIADVAGPDLCAALPAYHAFTGCDYISAFVRKGQVKPLIILRKQPDILTVFKEQGSTPKRYIYLHWRDSSVLCMANYSAIARIWYITNFSRHVTS